MIDELENELLDQTRLLLTPKALKLISQHFQSLSNKRPCIRQFPWFSHIWSTWRSVLLVEMLHLSYFSQCLSCCFSQRLNYLGGSCSALYFDTKAALLNSIRTSSQHWSMVEETSWCGLNQDLKLPGTQNGSLNQDKSLLLFCLLTHFIKISGTTWVTRRTEYGIKEQRHTSTTAQAAIVDIRSEETRGSNDRRENEKVAKRN